MREKLVNIWSLFKLEKYSQEANRFTPQKSQEEKMLPYLTEIYKKPTSVANLITKIITN